MFRTSPCSSKSDEINTIDSKLSEAQQKSFNDPNSWHNIFYAVITSGVDESVFSVIYDETHGRPNAPTRILVSMMILKEGFGFRYAKWFEQCQFNLQVRKALGLNKLNETVPVSSTYYAFKQAVRRYQVTSGEDLIGDLFQQLTKGQVQVFGVKGDKIRMDSTLMGSNITKNSRLQLILECLKVFWKSLDDEQKKGLSLDDRKRLSELTEKTPGQVTYRLSDEEKEEQLKSLGGLLLRLQSVKAVINTG